MADVQQSTEREEHCPRQTPRRKVRFPRPPSKLITSTAIPAGEVGEVLRSSPVSHRIERPKYPQGQQSRPGLAIRRGPPLELPQELTFQAELQRKKLEDELAAKLSIRPTADDLVDQHILSRTSSDISSPPAFPAIGIVWHLLIVFAAEEVPTGDPPQSPQAKLQKFFQRRPSQHELEERNILKDPKVAPAIQGAKVPPRNTLAVKKVCFLWY